MDSLLAPVIRQLPAVNFDNPLSYLDIALSVLIGAGFLFYMRKFPVFRVILGTIFLLLCGLFFYAIGFTVTGRLFNFVSSLIFISLPLIFAPEIRHYLGKLGGLHFLRVPAFSHRRRDEVLVKNLVESVFELAEKGTGALIVIQRRIGLGDLIDAGVIIDAKLSPEVLESIFFPNSPLHDGAVVTVGNRVVAARCVIQSLPQMKLSPPFGTRHKAGLSITHQTDAVAIIISEQRGEVSLAENGKLDLNLSRPGLTEKLSQLL